MSRHSSSRQGNKGTRSITSAPTSDPAMPVTSAAPTPPLPASSPPPLPPPSLSISAPPPPPPPPPQPATPRLPAIGAKLRCDSFEGGLAVLGEVIDVDPSGHDAQILLTLSALNRKWAIRADRVRGYDPAKCAGKWDHVASDYPQPGANSDFDRAFRPDLPDGTKMAPPQRPAFKPPRAARRDHAWARCRTALAALGFGIDDKQRRRWNEGEYGEFMAVALDGSPDCFEVVIQ